MTEDLAVVKSRMTDNARTEGFADENTSWEDPFTRKLTVYCPSNFLDALSSVLFETGASGLEEVPGGLAVYPQDDAQLGLFQEALVTFQTSLGGETPPFEIEVTQISSSWNQTWQDALRAEPLTSRLVFRPIHDTPAPDGEETLWFRPETSFGAGGHPTTRLAATFIEEFLEKRPKLSVLDVGCGSGVLTLVARFVGAKNVVAADIDPISVASTKTNLELNGLADGVEVALGSVGVTKDQFDLVVANINTPILRELSGGLAQRLAPRGTLVLTGLLEEDVSELTAVYEACGLKLEAQRSLQGWGLLEWRHNSQHL